LFSNIIDRIHHFNIELCTCRSPQEDVVACKNVSCLRGTGAAARCKASLGESPCSPTNARACARIFSVGPCRLAQTFAGRSVSSRLSGNGQTRASSSCMNDQIKLHRSRIGPSNHFDTRDGLNLNSSARRAVERALKTIIVEVDAIHRKEGGTNEANLNPTGSSSRKRLSDSRKRLLADQQSRHSVRGSRARLVRLRRVAIRERNGCWQVLKIAKPISRRLS
jgi:hypothetical protein